MRSIQILWVLSFAVPALAADTVTFKDGHFITGTYLGGSSREIRLQVGDRVQTLNIEDITGIQFGASSNQRVHEGGPGGGQWTHTSGWNQISGSDD